MELSADETSLLLRKGEGLPAGGGRFRAGGCVGRGGRRALMELSVDETSLLLTRGGGALLGEVSRVENATT